MVGAGAGRRRPFRKPQAWLRRRTWSKQRGVKLRSSSSESDGNCRPVIKTVLLDGDAASKVARKVGGGGDGATTSNRPCSVTTAEAVPAAGASRSVTATTAPQSQSTDTTSPPDASSYTTGLIAAELSRVTTTGGFGLFLDPNGLPRGFRGVTGTNGSTDAGAGSISGNILEAGSNDDDLNYSPMLGCCGCNEIRKHLVVEEGGCEGTCALSLGCCGCPGRCPMNNGCCNCDGSPKHDVETGRSDGIEQVSDGWNVRRRRLFGGRLCVDGTGQLYVIETGRGDRSTCIITVAVH